MEFPHYKREALTHGQSPGNGITPAPISREPLATEGEATPGPDDYNPYEERAREDAEQAMVADEDPTDGDDPFVFDDVGGAIGDFEFPSIGDGPQF